jgi:hypothetical protein
MRWRTVHPYRYARCPASGRYSHENARCHAARQSWKRASASRSVTGRPPIPFDLVVAHRVPIASAGKDEQPVEMRPPEPVHADWRQGTESSHDSPLEEGGFELPVPP